MILSIFGASSHSVATLLSANIYSTRISKLICGINSRALSARSTSVPFYQSTVYLRYGLMCTVILIGRSQLRQEACKGPVQEVLTWGSRSVLLERPFTYVLPKNCLWLGPFYHPKDKMPSLDRFSFSGNQMYYTAGVNCNQEFTLCFCPLHVQLLLHEDKSFHAQRLHFPSHR